MALVACRECKASISSTAATCPQCGAPVPKPSRSAVQWIIIIAAVFLIARCVSSRDTAPTTPQLSAAECQADLQCWAGRHQVEAEGPCRRAIEAQLRFDHEWTDGIGKPRFTRFGWKDPATGAFTLFGEQLRVQNAFGALQKADYACVYDPASKAVLQAIVEPR